jgi:hypothetical protein
LAAKDIEKSLLEKLKLSPVTCTRLKAKLKSYAYFHVFFNVEDTGLFKMIHPISNDYIFEVYKYRVISDTSTKITTVEVLSLTL